LLTALALSGLVALLGVAVVLLALDRDNGTGRAPPVSRRSSAFVGDGVNLLTNGSFEVSSFGVGMADGLAIWGDARPSLVNAPVTDGIWAQRSDVPAQRRGGVWFEVNVRPGAFYAQAVDVAKLSKM